MKISRNGDGVRVLCPRCGCDGPSAPSATEAYWLASERGWRAMLVIGGPAEFLCPECLVKVGRLK